MLKGKNKKIPRTKQGYFINFGESSAKMVAEQEHWNNGMEKWYF